jgi:hypothetical protein
MSPFLTPIAILLYSRIEIGMVDETIEDTGAERLPVLEHTLVGMSR